MSELEEVKEFDFAGVKAIRFSAICVELISDDPLNSHGLLSFSRVSQIDGAGPMSLNGLEKTTPIGMARFCFKSTENSVIVTAAGLIDYDCPERLLVENQELGIQLDIGVGMYGDSSVDVRNGVVSPSSLTIRSAKLVRLPFGCERSMVLVPMSWEF
jgi:hypothetical protein